MQSLKDYLAERGLNEASPPEMIEEARRAHRRQYKREYQCRSRREGRRLELQLTPAQYRQIIMAAQRHEQKVAPFARDAILAYLNREYIIPDDTVVQRLELAIRRIGTNVNQIAKRCNEKKIVDALNIARVNKLLVELEDAVTKAFRNPVEAS